MRQAIIDFFEILVQTGITCVRGPYRTKEIIQHMSHMGIGSLPIIVIATSFAGQVVTSQMAFHMDISLHTLSMMPGLSGQFIFREIGIAIPALLLVAKVGAATTAEVGTMKVTEQIDALRLLHIEPIPYLVYPRFIASILVTACLTLIAVFVTTACAMSFAVYQYNFSFLEYINGITHFITFKDLICAVVKSMCFGAIIPLVACFYGFRCKGGAEGVGTATTNSVVAAAIGVIITDFILTYIFSMIL